MAESPKLWLHEEILLLALRDKEGTISFGSMYEYAVGGAILAELMLENRVSVERVSARKQFVRLENMGPFGNDILDAALQKVSEATRRARLETWVTRFARMKDLKHRIARNLVQKGILDADESKILLLFTRKVYPERDPAAERELLDRLRKAIFSESNQIDSRTVVLLALAHHAGLLKESFTRQELKSRKQRIRSLANGDVAGDATRGAIEAVQAAVAASAAITAAVSATTVVTSG